MKRNVYFLTAIVIGLFVFGAAIANAQGPRPGGRNAPGAPAGTAARLTYQGRLTNSSGAPLNSAVNMVFKLYDSSSSLLWTSATRSVTPVNGLFTVYLGDGSDPDLDSALLFAATIGVTVSSDPEMIPRQPLNTVVGHGDNSNGVIGSSNSGNGVFGISISDVGVFGRSTGGDGVRGTTKNLSRAGISAIGAGDSGTALVIYNGGIQVSGAGIGSTTPVFVHVVTAGNIAGVFLNQTFITHPLTNGDPNAILIITPSYNYALAGGVNNPHPVGVYYSGASPFKWVIYNIDGFDMPVGAQFNVLVVKP